MNVTRTLQASTPFLNPLAANDGWHRLNDVAILASRFPLGLVAGANPYRYCDDDPLNLVDPTGLSDRANFIEATPAMPKNWQVHHIIEQGREIVVQRFADAGKDVHALDNLRGVDESVHQQISRIQGQFWAAKAEQYGRNSRDLDAAYRLTPLSEVESLQAEIESTYKGLWIEAGAAEAEVATVAKTVEQDARRGLGPAREISVLRNTGIVMVGFAIFTVIYDNVLLANNISNPSPQVQAAFDNMLVQYKAAYQQRIAGGIQRNQWWKLADATKEYLKVARFSDSVKGLVVRQFEVEGAKLP